MVRACESLKIGERVSLEGTYHRELNGFVRAEGVK